MYINIYNLFIYNVLINPVQFLHINASSCCGTLSHDLTLKQ